MAAATSAVGTSSSGVDHTRAEVIHQLGMFDTPDLKRFSSRTYYVVGKEQDIAETFSHTVSKVEVLYRKFREDGEDGASGDHPWVPSFSAKLGVYCEGDEHPRPCPKLSDDKHSISGMLQPLTVPSETPYQAKVIVYTTHSEFYREKIKQLNALLEKILA